MREHRGMTQAELAKSARTSAAYISQIERGRRRCGRRLLAKLGGALGVPPDLLAREEN
jgi:transcriptional regulator with XRE-family HTH domain